MLGAPTLRFSSLGAALGLCLSIACGGAGHYDGAVYIDRDDRTRFHVRAPTAAGGWRRAELGGHNDLAFVSDAMAAVIQVNASCSPELDIPLPALRNHLLIGFTERELLDESLVDMDGREALRTHTRAKLDGVPRELLLVVMKKNECVYDLALIAPTGDRFDRARLVFEEMVQSFRAEGRDP